MRSIENVSNRRWRINARSAATAAAVAVAFASTPISSSSIAMAFSAGNNNNIRVASSSSSSRPSAPRYTCLSTSCSPISNHDCRSAATTTKNKESFSSSSSLHAHGAIGRVAGLGVNRVRGVITSQTLKSRTKKTSGSRRSSRKTIATSTNAATIDDDIDITLGGKISSSSNNDDDDDEIGDEDCKHEKQKQKDKEEFKAAVEEVKGAAKDVVESTVQLGEAIKENSSSIVVPLVNKIFSKELRADISRRRKYYLSDWTDAFSSRKQILQTIPAILFLYFACLAPAISFGTIATDLTYGSIGVVEFLLSSGLSGMLYSVLCGQPMAFIAPTGLTLAFISGLFRFCKFNSIPFFPVYTWVGLWTSFFMVSLGVGGSSKLIRYCTRFTDEVFNALLSMNFLYEALASLRRNFLVSDPMNLSMPFVSLSMALGTFWSTLKVAAMEKTIFFNQKIRTNIKNFGPASIIILMSILNLHPWVNKFNVPTLSRSVPNYFQLAGGRDFLIPLKSIPVATRMLCALPAVLLTSLFFMDQNISVRVVNNPDNKLKKGEAYNLDMIALGIVTFGLSLVGLPWMCGATVQSMNHVVAMSHTEFNVETQELEVVDVAETRTTGFIIHALIAATIGLLPLLSFLPTPVVAGVFLFLGRKLMRGNSFLTRIRDGVSEVRRLPPDHPVRRLGRKKMNIFTGLQFGCLLALWGFKQCAATAIFFPSVIGMLMAIRAFVLPKFFTEEEFVALGDPSP